MTRVPKHDSKQEGKGGNGEHSWVGLTIGVHSVGVNQALESSSVFVGPILFIYDLGLLILYIVIPVVCWVDLCCWYLFYCWRYS